MRQSDKRLTAPWPRRSVAPMPMRFDVLRHGQAQPADAAGDAARTLTPAGTAAARALGHRLRPSGWRPQRALISTYLRARQTASLVLASAGVSLEPEVVDDLLPDHDAARVAVVLQALLDGTHHALLVGHQPLLGTLIEWWTGVSRPLS